MVSPFGDEIREFQVVMPHWDFTSRPAGWVGWWGRGMTWQYTANRFSPTLWSYFEQIMLTAFQFSFFIKLQKVHGSSCRPGAQRPDIYGNTRMKHIESHRMMTVVEGGTPSTRGSTFNEKIWKVKSLTGATSNARPLVMWSSGQFFLWVLISKAVIQPSLATIKNHTVRYAKIRLCEQNLQGVLQWSS